MANDKDYEELLRRYENTRPTPPPPVRQTQSAERDKANLKGGVYFSNPPTMDTKRPAQQPKRKGSGRKLNIDTNNNKKGNNKKGKNKNGFVRFFTSKGFKRFAIMLAVITVVSAVLCYIGIQCINDVLALDAEDTSIEVVIQDGMGDSEVLDVLKENKLIKNKAFCKVFITIFDKDGDYIPGSYTLNPTMGVEKMIATMKTDYKGGESVTLTFPEGYTVQQIAKKLEENKVCTASSFITTLQSVDFSNEYTFLKTITNKEKRFCALEGYIFPDTYEFYVGENASSVVRRFLDNFESKWTDEYQEQADKMGKTVDEIVIMASVLQAEAADSSQMADIASVLYNRLDKPTAFPQLQCDSTEDYLLEVIKPTLSSSVEDSQKYLEYRDLYDTYSEACDGLPVGAVSNPGNSAIKAALYPSDTNYFYFRHDAKGGVYYASSYAEHEQNGRKAASVG